MFGASSLCAFFNGSLNIHIAGYVWLICLCLTTERRLLCSVSWLNGNIRTN